MTKIIANENKKDDLKNTIEMLLTEENNQIISNSLSLDSLARIISKISYQKTKPNIYDSEDEISFIALVRKFPI